MKPTNLKVTYFLLQYEANCSNCGAPLKNTMNINSIGNDISHYCVQCKTTNHIDFKDLVRKKLQPDA